MRQPSTNVLVTPPSGATVFAASQTSYALQSTDGLATITNVAAPFAKLDSQTGLTTISTTGTTLFLGDPNGATFSAPYSLLH